MTTAMFFSILATVLSSPSECCARFSARQPEPKVNVTVVAILASDRCTHIDDRLKDLACELQAFDPKLTGFSVVSMTKMPLGAKEKGSVVCLEDARVEVMVKHCLDKDNKACLVVKAPLQSEFEYTTVCGKYLPVMTRFQAKERIPPLWVAQAVGQAAASGALGTFQAAGTLAEGRCRPRLIVAICVQPCNGK